MRLMYVLPAEAFGGAERQGVLHIRKLAEYGFVLTAIVGPGTPVQDELRRYGFHDYHYCAVFPRATHSKMGIPGNIRYRLGYARAFVKTSNQVMAIGRKSQTEMILAGRSFGWAVAARAAHALGIPYVVRAGSRATHRSLLAGIRAMRYRYGRPAALLSNCLAVEQSLLPTFNCPAYIVPNGVDTERFAPIREVASDALGDPVIGLAARPSPEKGMNIFFETVLATRRVFPNAVFEVAGEFGWRKHYEDQVRQRGLSASIRFLGHVPSMPKFYGHCDIVILTSLARSIEGSPNAVLEAMSMAKPVVASDVGGMSEIIRDGIEGFLVAPSATEFAARIVDLLRDPARAAAMGKAARARILRCSTEDRAMEALVNALDAIRPAGHRRWSGSKPLHPV